MFVGGIMVIKAKKSILDENGNPDIEKIRSIRLSMWPILENSGSVAKNHNKDSIE